jgi:hypothetical protein
MCKGNALMKLCCGCRFLSLVVYSEGDDWRLFISSQSTSVYCFPLKWLQPPLLFSLLLHKSSLILKFIVSKREHSLQFIKLFSADCIPVSSLVILTEIWPSLTRIRIQCCMVLFCRVFNPFSICFSPLSKNESSPNHQPVCVCVPSNFWTDWWIFMKFGRWVMPLKTTQTPHLLIS